MILDMYMDASFSFFVAIVAGVETDTILFFYNLGKKQDLLNRPHQTTSFARISIFLNMWRGICKTIEFWSGLLKRSCSKDLGLWWE